MCRARTQGGRRCPAHSDPIAVKARGVRQRIGRYTRRLDAAETACVVAFQSDDTQTIDKATAQVDKWERLLRGAFADANHLVPQQAPPPPTRATEFTPASTIDWTDDQLAAAYTDCEGDLLAQEAILGCFDWRDDVRERATAEAEAEQAAQEAAAWRAATERAAAEDPGGLATSTTKRRKLSRDQQLREEYDTYIHVQWLQAEEDCRGHLLNKEGDARGIDPRTLFEGPVARAKRYGSEELQAWFRTNGRMSFASWCYQARGPEADPTSKRGRALRAAAERDRIEDFAHVS